VASVKQDSREAQGRDASTVSQVVSAAAAASVALTDVGVRSGFLRAIAAALEAQRERVIAAAAAETALTPDELAPEFARMVGVLRQFADVIMRPETWRPASDAAVATELLTTSPPVGPNHALRSRLVPLGHVVAVFGASNFPLAYGVMGTDGASALAAGCAVVVKEHPAHPLTGRLIHSVVQGVAASCGIAPGVVGYVRNEDPRDFGPAQALVAHADIAAVGFTGSISAGIAIADLARARARPIPAFCEMGSANPIYVTAAAMSQRPEAIAAALAPSILARFGQQCTRPGIIVCIGRESAIIDGPFVRTLAAAVAASPSRDMLAPWIAASYAKRLREFAAFDGVRVLAGNPAAGALEESRRGTPALLWASDATMQAQGVLREEIFGPAAIITASASAREVPLLHPSLTATIWSGADVENDPQVPPIFDRAVATAGRVILNGVPTGVRVAEAMVHGGPYPATNQPSSTAVGPRAMERWLRPVCLQGWGEATP